LLDLKIKVARSLLNKKRKKMAGAIFDIVKEMG